MKKANTLESAIVDLRANGHQVVEIPPHGYVALIGVYGSDTEIAQTARLTSGSAGKDDRGLIRYLMRHKHMSPFEFGHVVFEVGAPLFVFRQWHRHRMASINEVSARYTELPCEQWTPAPERVQGRPADVKQGSGLQLEPDVVNTALAIHSQATAASVSAYEALLALGEAPEIARAVLPVSTYSRMRWATDIRNLLHFLGLRQESHAQQEIRVFADAMNALITPYFPWTLEAFDDFALSAVSLSRLERMAVDLVTKFPEEYRWQVKHPTGETATRIEWERAALDAGASKSEAKEFAEKMSRPAS